MAIKNKSNTRFGIFYRSHGKWTTVPYRNITFTNYTVNRNPLKDEVSHLKNFILKSKIKIMPVK